MRRTRTGASIPCCGARGRRRARGWLTRGPATAGASSEIITFLRAHGIRRVSDGGGDPTEDIHVHLVPADTVDEWLAARLAEGVLVDSKVYTGLYFWLRDRRGQTAARA